MLLLVAVGLLAGALTSISPGSAPSRTEHGYRVDDPMEHYVRVITACEMVTVR